MKLIFSLLSFKIPDYVTYENTQIWALWIFIFQCWVFQFYFPSVEKDASSYNRWLKTCMEEDRTCPRSHFYCLPKVSEVPTLQNRCRSFYMTSQKRSFSVIKNERSGLVFAKTGARNYRPCFRENQPKRSFSIKWKRAFWACFRENWVYKFGHGSINSATGYIEPQLCTSRIDARLYRHGLINYIDTKANCCYLKMT